MSGHPQCPQWCVAETRADDFVSHYSADPYDETAVCLVQSFGGEGGDDAEPFVKVGAEVLAPDNVLTLERAGRLAAELIAAIQLAAAG